MEFKINTVLKDNDGYIIIKDYDMQNDFYICYECNKYGRIIDYFMLLLKVYVLQQMKVIEGK